MRHTLHLNVPEEIYRLLIARAEEIGRSPEVLATQWLSAAAHKASTDPLEPFIGALESSVPDWANQHDEHLSRNVMQDPNTAAHGDSSDA